MTEITYYSGHLTISNSQEVIQIQLNDLPMMDRQALKDACKYLNIK